MVAFRYDIFPDNEAHKAYILGQSLYPSHSVLKSSKDT